MENSQKAKWNIIFLIYAELLDTATKRAAQLEGIEYIKGDLRKLMSTISGLKTSDNFNLFVVENVVKVKVKENKVISDTTFISLLVSDPDKKKSTLKQLDESLNENFLQKSIDIQRVFQFVDTKYPACKNLVITWDHGSAFGIFKKVYSDGKLHVRNESLLREKYEILAEHNGDANDLFIIRNKKIPRLKPFDDLPQNVGDNADSATPDFDILSNDQLASAITKGFKNKYVDTLIMFNCDMQNMHACNSFKNCVKYYVAPQGPMTAPGYDYESIVNLIGNKMNFPVDGAMVAVMAINTIKQIFIRDKMESEFANISAFAVCLEKYEEKIIDLMRFFVREITAMMEKDISVKWNIQIVRGKCYAISADLFYYLVDINNFLINLNRSITRNARLLELKNQLQTVYDSIIIARTMGDDVYYLDQNSWENFTNIPPTGVTIYFPPGAIDPSDVVVKNFVLPNSPFSSSLFADIHWLEFINFLYKTPENNIAGHLNGGR